MIKLGAELRDTMTGFRGFAVSRTIFLYGCERWTLQPVKDNEGKLPAQQTFDEPRLEVVEDGTVGFVK